VKIAYSLYELIGYKTTRRGALLKIVFKSGFTGYADCHPWVELFDEPLNVQLELLKQDKITKLTAKSLYYAELDAIARSSEINLLMGLKIPESNYLITNLMLPDLSAQIEKAKLHGFKTFKVKLGNNLDKELAILKDNFSKGMILRLDFNSKLNDKTFSQVFKTLKKMDLCIDYIEDPFPFDENAWKQIQDEEGVELAADLYLESAVNKPHAAKVLIVKPAVTGSIVSTTQKIVVTSYLDHPFGQCTAAYEASKYKSVTCGLLTHHLYEKNLFSDQLTNHGCNFKVPQGFGFGFDKLLQNLDWINL
jgi:O-succinylbenzoate synthase